MEMKHRALRFGSFTLDLERLCLLGPSGQADLRRKSFEVLRYLAEHAGRVVTREEVMSAVWPDVTVGDESLTQCIRDVRRALGDEGRRIVKTVARRGYLMDVPISAGDAGATLPPEATKVVETAEAMPLALPDRPSIAVLAFTNMSGDPDQEYFSDGITDDIITGLSRFSELFVIARNSSFQYKGRSPDIRQVGRELGVRYVLEGSIRRAGDRVRIGAQLIDAVTGAHRWGERYDRELKDVFAVQDEVSRAIVAILVAHVNKAEAERRLLKPPATWQAHDFVMRASDICRATSSSRNVAGLHEALRLLKHAISLDPNYARAYAMLSVAHFMAWVEPLDEDHLSPAVLERAHRFARKAVQLDPNLPIAHAQLGKVLTFEGQHDQSIAAFEKAFALNRNFTDWWFGAALNRAGEPARATEVIEAQMRYDPFHSPAASGALGFARYMLKEYSHALPPLRECASRAPNLSVCHLWLAATLAQLGQLDEARAEAAEVLRINAKFTIDGTQRRLSLFKRPEDVEHFFDGLRKAGLPER
jgi:adenylate cyclase